MKVKAVQYLVLGEDAPTDPRCSTLLCLDEPAPLWNPRADRLWIAGKEHDFGCIHPFGPSPDPDAPHGVQWVVPGCHDFVGATVLRREGARTRAESDAERFRRAEMAATSWNGGPCAAKVADCIPVHRPGKGYLTILGFDVPVPTEGVTCVQVGGKEYAFVYEQAHGSGRLIWPPMGVGIEGLHDLEGATAYFR